MVAPPPRDRRRRRHGFSDRLSTGLLHPSLAFRCRRRSAARYRLVFFAIDRFSRGANWRSIIAGVVLFAGAFLALRLLPLFRVNDPTPMVWRGDPAGLVDLSAYAPNTIERRYRRLRLGRAPQGSGISSSRRRPSICHWRGAANTI